jgi:hypothetical protein
METNRIVTWNSAQEYANQVSKASHAGFLTPSQDRLISQEIYDTETDLGQSRESTDIGFFGELRNIEWIARSVRSYKTISDCNKNIIESLIKIKNPSKLLNVSSSMLPLAFYDQFDQIEITVTNDEQLYRYENYYRKDEAIFDTVEILDLYTGNLPESVDMIITNAEDLLFAVSDTLIHNLLEILDDSGVMVLYHSNEMLLMYKDGIDSQMGLFHSKLNSISNINIYHYPISSGITVIIKNAV